jgi:hypothetical protein
LVDDGIVGQRDDLVPDRVVGAQDVVAVASTTGRQQLADEAPEHPRLFGNLWALIVFKNIKLFEVGHFLCLNKIRA